MDTRAASAQPAGAGPPAAASALSRSRLLWAASLRHLLRHPAQLALAFLGLSLGVATIIAVDIATASSRRAFELSMAAVNGAATHQIVGGSQGIDESLYLRLRRELGPGSDPGSAALAPVIDGYATIGNRSLELIGIDPFASAELAAGGTRRLPGVHESPDADVPSLTTLAGWLSRPGAVVLAERTAQQLGLGPQASFVVQAGDAERPATLVNTIHDEGGGHDTLLLTDIATAQEWLGMPGHLTRVDLRVPAGATGTRMLASIRALLPADVQLTETAGRTQESLDMTGAFTTNLQAMSLLALLVSALLIYGAISFAVVQRRRLIGILRALGATRREVLAIVLAEAGALGVLGACAGLVAGRLIGQGLVRLVSQTINDLYFVVVVNQTVLPASSIVKALGAGVCTALVAGLLPALEVAASPPQLGLRRSSLESRAVHLARRLVIASVVLALASGLVILLSQRSLFAGFASLFMLLLSVAALTPAVLRALAAGAARLSGRASPVARLAFGSIAASLSRTGVAVAALGMALAAMIGVSVMVASFRTSLSDWLTQTMSADLYVTPPGRGTEPGRRLDPATLVALSHIPGITAHTETRLAEVQSPQGTLSVDALQRFPRGGWSRPIAPGVDARAWSELEQGAIIIAEPLAWRLQLRRGDSLTLSTAQGPRPFRIAGLYREYSTGRSNVLMSLAEYRRRWQDEGVTGVGVYLAPGAEPDRVIAALRAASGGRQALFIRSNADLRSMSMSIFDRTFVITRVLNWLAAGVAAVGLVSSLLAWELERSHELAILRALGLTPRGAAVLIEAQTGFMGLAALVAAIPAGLLTALVLTEVINRRAFGWHIDMHLSAGQLTSALWLALAAALVAGLYPAWRTARAPIAADIREE
jgi:putative ABC transport system permease protein